MRNLSNTSFRSVDDWKAALMTLPENNFFELLRSVFGNIKTPFNKQRLLDDLFNLLSRDEIRKTIAAYIDEQDHKVIAAVAILGEPAPGDLESFFAGEVTCAELHALVINLEERLILYRFKDKDIPHLALNPVLEKVLAPLIADTGPLFPSFSMGDDFPLKSSSGLSPLSSNPARKAAGKADNKVKSKAGDLAAGLADSRILAALFAYIYGEEELLKAEAGSLSRGLRKKVLDNGKELFPALDLELAVSILLHLGLFICEGRTLKPCREKIADFSMLSPEEREEYWAAGLYLCLNEKTDTGTNNLATNENVAGNFDVFSPGYSESLTARYSRNRLREIAAFIHSFRDLVAPERKYPEITLRRLANLLEKEDLELGNIWGSRLFDSRAGLPFEPFLALMEKTGILERIGTCWKAGRAAAAASKAAAAVAGKSSGGADTAEPVIVMDTAFSLILYPEIAFADALTLASFCSVKDPGSHPQWSDGTIVRFELTRESAVRGFDQGMGADYMTELLRRLSLNRLDDNLGWTLKDWENRYAGVSLHQGIVLNLAEDRRYLAEARPVASLISRTLVPGVYLLSSGDRTEAARALRKAGVDIIAQPPTVPGTESGRGISTGHFRDFFPRLDSAGKTGPLSSLSFHDRDKEGTGEKTSPAGRVKADSAKTDPAKADPAYSIKQKYRQLLEKKQLTKQERDELEARIERRLVLSEAQLERTSLRYEKLEARGIDYAGKSAIAKQAIDAGSLLDVSWTGPGGEIRRVLGTPSALEKKDGESILVLKTPVPGDAVSRETVRIPLGKISLLRRIKQSIFGE